MAGALDRLLATPAGNILIAFVLIQVLCVIAGLIYPDQFRYLSPSNISIMLKAIPTLGILALGVGLLMISGEFDLSVGSIYAFTAVVCSMLIAYGMPAWIAAPMIIAVGAMISMFNGFLALKFALPSFIVSLGAMLFWKGMIFFVHGAQAIRFEGSEGFRNLMAGKLGPLEMPFVWFLLLAVIFQLVLRHHAFGNHIFAVGGDRAAATANGVNPAKVKLTCFALAGACAALSGIISAARVGSVTPAQGGGLELQAIAACVIGGVALTGGRGSMIGVFLGAALIYTIQDVLLLMRAPGFYLDIFVGALIVLAAIANQLVGGKAAK
ncbi:ABC transporter permease [Falsihalocynthiibacter sp. SS001]|uniref:ABC transporter permease n=1 Tax=Falsihalocynthiibacter sp. SS001 TaxID=3349698 RepID=UPI0036D3D294